VEGKQQSRRSSEDEARRVVKRESLKRYIVESAGRVTI
jgi:hypothetical protein